MSVLTASRLLKTAGTIGAVLLLAACSTLTLGEQRKIEADTLSGNFESDYDILTCEEMAVIETSARFRVEALDPAAEDHAEQLTLLQARIEELVASRELKSCPVPIAAREAAAAPAQPAPQVTTQTVAVAAAAPAPAPAAQPAAQTGQFLQIGLFSDASNAQSVADHFASLGFRVETRLSGTSGNPVHRVLVGPLESSADSARAEASARDYGVEDAYFVDG